MSRRSDRSGDQLLLGPRHGAEDGAGRRAYEAYADLDPAGPLPPAKRRFIDYPRRGRRGWTRWVPSWRLILSLVLLAVAAVCAVVLYLYSTTDVPSQANADALFQTTVVMDAQGHEIGSFEAQKRTWKPLKEIPPYVRQAAIAAEDRSFYSNQGVSFTAIVRAALNNVRGGPTQGGSTITQQYVKNFYSSTKDRSFGRKLNEFFVSIKTAQTLTKDQILERYLNIIYYGRGCYGIEAASQCYFGKSVAKLTPSEAAYLAGIVDGPELYASDAKASGPAAQARWAYVRDGMASLGAVTPVQLAAMKFPKPLPVERKVKQTYGNQTEYLLAMVRDDAKRYGISEQELQRGGYRITTTFQPDKVRDAQQSVSQVLGPSNRWPKGTVVGIATVDVTNGQIVSVYAGDGKRQQNAVTQDIAQAGSTFKPFTLIAALEGQRESGDCDPKPAGPDSLSLRSRVDGRSPQTFAKLPAPVTNDEPGPGGFVDLVTATAESVNTAYVQLNQTVTPEHTERVAVCAGLPTATLGLSAGLNNVLGTSSPHPLDMVRAYATIASGGIYHDTSVISKVVRPDGGEVLPERKPEAKRVFDKDVVADATYAMQAVVKEGTGTAVQGVGRPVAGKTGTTTGYKSAWFVGFTPRYATVVVMQRLKNENPIALAPFAGLSGDVYGGTLPAQVWTAYMKAFLDGTPVQDFPPPVYGGTTVNPSPSPTPTPTPSASVVPSPSTSAKPSPTPTPTGTPSPTPTEPLPSPTPTAPAPPSPDPSPPGKPKPTPTQ